MQHPLPINSKKFWDQLFKNSWEERRGREQTIFFAKVAFDHFPDWLLKEIHSRAYTICDVGCALGDAVHALAQAFPNSIVKGIDFSQEAISKAKQLYPAYKFDVEDVTKISKSYDVIFSSNTLEHFHEPIPVMHKLLQQTNQYLILLLPFQDDTGTAEHFFRFDFEHFPEKINHFQLSHLQEIDCSLIPHSYWNAKQVLVIYEKEK